MNSMSTTKVDRRVQRTRALLQESLLALVAEQGYDTLTIQQITDKANLRRATFYMHYRDKEELLLSALAERFDTLAREAEHFSQADGLGGKTQLEAYLVTFKHAQQNYKLYKNLLSGQSGTVFTRHVRDYLAGLIQKGLHTLPSERLPIPIETLAAYIAGAELAMITWWLERDMPYPAEQMAQTVQTLVLHGVSDMLTLHRR